MKRDKHLPRPGRIVLYPAYLWGIETRGKREYNSAGTCIQPTYEELKHNKVHKEIPNYQGIQPTYEELKHERQRELFEEQLRIQPTYEELKPGFAISFTS